MKKAVLKRRTVFTETIVSFTPNMKQLLFGLMAMAGATTVLAQNPKTAMTNAAMSLEGYDSDRSKTDELDKAREDIDFAAGHEKTKNDPKVWRYRGKIYNRIAFDAKLKGEYKDAGLKAVESFNKAWDLEAAKLEEKGKPLSKMPVKSEFKNGFESAGRALYNGGADAYNEENYDLAYRSFIAILDIPNKTKEGLAKKPVVLVTANDIDMLKEAARLGGMAAVQLDRPEDAERLLLPLLEGKKMSEKLIPSTYSMLASAWQKAGDTDKAQTILTKARKQYPTNQNLLIAEINLALAQGKLKELEGKLMQAVEGDKENVELHFVLGNVYDGIFREKLEKGENDLAKDFFNKSVSWYKKAAEIDKKHFNSHYSLGALHVNYSNAFAKRMNEVTDFKSAEYKALKTRYNELLDLGLVHLLDAQAINSSDLGINIALKEVYSRKNDESNYMKYKTKVEELQKK